MTKEINQRSIIEVRTQTFQALVDALQAIRSRNTETHVPTDISISELLTTCQTILAGEERLKCFEPLVRHRSRMFNMYENDTNPATEFANTVLILAHLLDTLTEKSGLGSYSTSIRSLLNHELYYLPLNDISVRAKEVAQTLIASDLSVLGSAVLGTV